MLKFNIKPPYYAVIFTAITGDDLQGYSDLSAQLRTEASKIPGFLGIEGQGEGSEITVSYWKNLDAIEEWKNNLDHGRAKNLGKSKWYKEHRTRICKVEMEYGS